MVRDRGILPVRSDFCSYYMSDCNNYKSPSGAKSKKGTNELPNKKTGKFENGSSIVAGMSVEWDQLAGIIENNKYMKSMKKQSKKLVDALDQLKSALDHKTSIK